MGSIWNVPEYRPPYRLGTVDCILEEDHQFSHEFTLHPSSNPDFFKFQDLSFPIGVATKKDGTYRTRFGPCLETEAVIYAANDNNMKYAMRRQTAIRVPELIGYHSYLRDNQSNFLNSNKDFITYLRESYAYAFVDYKGAEQEMEEHYDDPHDKRALRIQARDQLHDEGIHVDPRHVWTRNVGLKQKKAEYAKNLKKKPRSIGDFGVAASLKGFRLTGILKQAQNDTPIEFLGGVAHFCKSPDPFALETHFRELISPSKAFHFVYFSDDSCLSIWNKTTKQVDYYNLDISSCDTSHGPLLFQALVDLMPNDFTKNDMQLLVDQCGLPLQVVSVSDPKNKIKIIPKFPKLSSGSTITTAINNLASLLAVLSIVKNYDHPASPHRDDHGNLCDNPYMVAAAAEVGYIFTGCTPLASPHKIQFLKHSPVQDENGHWRPMLNLGVLFRASGTCEGDLPGKGDILERARSFQRGLLQGAYPYCRFDLLRNMYDAIGVGPVFLNKVFSMKVTADADKYPPFYVPKENIMLRYDLEEVDYSSLVDFTCMDVSHFYAGDGASKILQLDYGVSTTEHNRVPYVLYQTIDASIGATPME